MRRLLAVMEYDGTDFEGFQIQKHRRTVQGELEKALSQITGEKIRVTGSGRTDTGVHAAGMAAHFDTNWARPLPVLQRALNAVLPTDIALRQLRETPAGFSARFSARSRAYRYAILNQADRSPLAERYALLVPHPLDADAMDTAVRYLIGQHDFGAFGTPPQGDNTVRVMYAAQVKREGVHLWIDLKANAFLYRMVRRIVGTLLWVGEGKLSPVEFRQVLEKKRRAGESAPPHGLCLIAVEYEL